MNLSVSIPHQSPQRKPWIFDSRTNLPSHSHNLWKIESGVVRTLTWSEDGSLIILGLWGPGDVVGKVLSKSDPYQIESLTQVKAFPQTLSETPNIAEILLDYVQQLEALITIRNQKKTELMLLNLLSWLAQRFGREVKTGQLIDLRLTHQDIAEILGSTRVTITRILSQLEQQGIIDRLPLHRFVLREESIWHYEI